MESGVHLPQIDFGGQGLTSDRLLRVVRQARACGFAAVSANDHFRFGRPWLDGLVALSLVAPHTGPMDVVTSVALPSLRGPVPLASALVSIAHLSGGRVVAGVGPGSSPADHDVAGVGFEDRWGRFDRSVEALRSLLQEESPLAGKDLGNGADVVIPVWVASWGSEIGLRRVARLGDGWMASAYNTDPDRFAAGLGIIAAERARLGRLPAEVPAALATMWTWVTEDGAEADRVLAEVLAPMIGRPPEQLRSRVCVGSAQQCVELLSLYSQSGCRRVHFWPMGDEEHQLQLLTERVLPHVGR